MDGYRNTSGGVPRPRIDQPPKLDIMYVPAIDTRGVT